MGLITSAESNITEILKDWNNEGPQAWNALLGLVYQQLYQKACRLISTNAKSADLSATLLMSELYLRYHNKPMEWQNRQHFYAHAVLTLRGILIDYLRKRKPGTITQINHEETAKLFGNNTQSVDLLALEEALIRLEVLNERWCRVVEYRFLLGLSIQEVAETLEVSEATVNNYWALARRWLYRYLNTKTAS